MSGDIDSDSGPPDTGVGLDVVTVTAPVATLNWALLAVVAVGVWWVYSNWSPSYDDGFGDYDAD